MKKRKLCNHNILCEVEPGLSTGPLRYGQNVRIRKSTYTKTGLMELFPGDFELIFLNFEIITQCQFYNKTFTYKHGENLSVGFNTYHGYSTKNLRFSGKISVQPHTTLCIQFLNRENNDKNNTLPLGKQICFTIVWGCAEILPKSLFRAWKQPFAITDLLDDQLA